MEYLLAEKSRIPCLDRLWQRVFGDTPEEREAFFRRVFPLTRAYCAMEGDAAAAMVYCIPNPLRLEGKTLPLYYLYALGTDPRYRGGGLASGLLLHAEAALKAEGAAGVFLVPGAPSLCVYYDRMGYLPWCRAACREGVLPLGEPCTAEEYLALRPSDAVLLPPPETLLWCAARKWASGACLMDFAHGKPRVLELLGRPEYGEEPCEYLLPAVGGGVRALYKPLTGGVPEWNGAVFSME